MKRRNYSYYKTQILLEQAKISNLSKKLSYCNVCNAIIPRSRLNWHRNTNAHILRIPIYEHQSLDQTRCEMEESLLLISKQVDEIEIESRINKIETLRKGILDDLEKLEKNRHLM